MNARRTIRWTGPRHLGPICLVVFSFASQICLAQTPATLNSDADSRKWEEFSSPNGQFVVSMPAKPKFQAIPLDSKADALVAHILALDIGGESYGVSYLEFPNRVDDAAKSKAVLDVIAEKEVVKIVGKLMSQTDIAIDGYRGREIAIEVSDGFWVDRLYLVGRRVYFVSAFASKSRPEVKELTEQQKALIRKYFESFKLKLEP